MNRRSKSGMRFLAVVFCCLAIVAPGFAAVPGAERLLPDDTLLMLTAPDFPRVRAILDRTPQARLWDDPLLKPFKDNFIAKFTQDIAKPLERDLNISIQEYTDLAQGQLTFAMIRGSNADTPGLVLFFDAKEKTSSLKSSLSTLRAKWVEAGRVMRTEKIRDAEFLVVTLPANAPSRASKQIFLPDFSSDSDPKSRAAAKSELVIGRADSLLIIANSLKAAEKIVARLGGSGAPALGDLAAYQANHTALFRDAPVYAWANVKALNDLSNPPAPSPNTAQLDAFGTAGESRYLSATGVMGIKSVAATLRPSPEGLLAQVTFTAPESARESVFKTRPGESRDCTVPAFVPADAVEFKRWRVDGQQAFAAFEKFLAEVSPQAASGISSILDLANQNARLKDPTFDIRKNLIGNLGNDLITYSKAPRSLSPADLEAPPGITLLASPNPDQFVAAFQNILIFMSAQAEKPDEREFLGRRILSVSLPPLAIPFIESKPHAARTIHYAASGGYVAISSDASLLEEFLRRSENQGRTLRDTAGLAEAAQKVLGPGTILFGFENQAETFKGQLEQWKLEAFAATNPPPSNLPLPPFGGSEKGVRDWMDFSLIPAYDSISKYFHFGVYGISAGVDGFTLKYFLPTPPAFRSAESAAR